MLQFVPRHRQLHRTSLLSDYGSFVQRTSDLVTPPMASEGWAQSRVRSLADCVPFRCSRSTSVSVELVLDQNDTGDHDLTTTAEPFTLHSFGQCSATFWASAGFLSKSSKDISCIGVRLVWLATLFIIQVEAGLQSAQGR